MKQIASLALVILFLLLIVGALSCDESDYDAADYGDDDDDDDDNNDDNNDDNDDDNNDTSEPYPPVLPFSFVREDDSEPISPAELQAFSEQMRDFYADREYIDWLLRMSHGIDASTGMSDYRLWWGEVLGIKNGDTVSIVHEYSEEHGGHNILKGNSLVLTSAVAGYLSTGDATLGELTRQFCKGVSSTMLGMVYDENDPIKHLMARNVVTANHTYTTHDGRRKAVDYSNWTFPYDRWNCSRFSYEHNPYWGEVWVTNTRSKDGLGYLYRAALSANHAATHGADPAVREACGETWNLLTLLAADIVDHDYIIRSKHNDGTAYRPGVDPEPEEADIGDIASLVKWDILFPDAECNATQATAFLGYGERLDNNCDPFGGHRIYELGAILNNPPNGHIMRSFHIANVALALHNSDNRAAFQALESLEQRFTRDTNLNLAFVDTPEDSWQRDIAVSLLQSTTVGYYLTNDEVRVIHHYARRAMEEYGAWENWDPWASSVPEGVEIEVMPPTGKTLPDESKVSWLQPYVLGLFMDYCWGMYRNPDSPPVIDCDVFTF
ncbi:MAG: hypothetical protein P9L99_16675 [Candidatus Lernaella stagnicola]|nr:hypothetical protein [Candidatus Lernaella stagnicola]